MSSARFIIGFGWAEKVELNSVSEALRRVGSGSRGRSSCSSWTGPYLFGADLLGRDAQIGLLLLFGAFDLLLLRARQRVQLGVVAAQQLRRLLVEAALLQSQTTATTKRTVR